MDRVMCRDQYGGVRLRPHMDVADAPDDQHYMRSSDPRYLRAWQVYVKPINRLENCYGGENCEIPNNRGA